MKLGIKTRLKIDPLNFFFIVSSLLCFLFIRKYFIIIFPLQIVWGMYAFKMKFTFNQIIFLALTFLVTGVSFMLSERHIINYIMSIVLTMSVFIFLTSVPEKTHSDVSYSDTFFKVSSNILLFVNSVAFINYILLTLHSSNILEIEDSFAGIYGKSGLGQHALSVINFMYAAFFVLKKKMLKFWIFLICGIMGFYGLGLMLLMASGIIVVFTSAKLNYKHFLFVGFSLWAIIVLLKIANPRNYNYILDNINKTTASFQGLNYDAEMLKAKKVRWSESPRKVVFFYGALRRLMSNPEIFLIGTSPGSYNSMTAFMLNGDYTRIGLLKENVNNLPTYHEEDVLPLWNQEIYSTTWMDGTRNQPFSSFVSVLMEYGMFIGILYFLWMGKKIRYLVKSINDKEIKYFVLFSSLFFGLSLFFLNTIEMVDLVFVYLLMIKSIEIDYVKVR
jgi:hypothetical protein